MAIAMRCVAALAMIGAQTPASAPASHAQVRRPDPLRIEYPHPMRIAVPGGARSVSSLLRVRGPLRFGSYVWRDVAGSGPIWIRVDPVDQTMSVFRGGDEIGSTVVLFGAEGRDTPRGAFRVLERDRDHVSSLYDAPMPFMLRLTVDGVAIHASDVRAGRATHGCIGVPAAFAERLFEIARRGDVVYVV